MAIGASAASALSLVFRELVLRLAIEAMIGIAVGLSAAQVLRTAFYGVYPVDALVVAVVWLLAAYAPARRITGPICARD